MPTSKHVGLNCNGNKTFRRVIHLAPSVGKDVSREETSARTVRSWRRTGPQLGELLDLDVSTETESIYLDYEVVNYLRALQTLLDV